MIRERKLQRIHCQLICTVTKVKGNVPGTKNSLVIIKTATKNEGKVNERAALVSYEEAPVETENVETTEEVVEETTEVTE